MAPLRRLRPHDDSERSIESIEERLDREAVSTELIDVPAAVVCLVCGEVDCPGCEQNEQSRSGIVAIVAWERPALSAWARLWSTARSTTRDAETFFELLPDGPVMPALRFAAICEILATSAFLLCFMLIAGVVAPDWVKHLVFDAHARGIVLRVGILGVPAFAGLLVFAHAIHGLTIDVGAKRNGARGARSRALRFGLYACGWDLVMGPLGILVVAVKEGVSAGLSILGLMSSPLPTRATRAFLRGCYRLEGESAKKALSTAFTGTIVTTLLAAIAILASLVALAVA